MATCASWSGVAAEQAALSHAHLLSYLSSLESMVLEAQQVLDT